MSPLNIGFPCTDSTPFFQQPAHAVEGSAPTWSLGEGDSIDSLADIAVATDPPISDFLQRSTSLSDQSGVNPAPLFLGLSLAQSTTVNLQPAYLDEGAVPHDSTLTPTESTSHRVGQDESVQSGPNKSPTQALSARILLLEQEVKAERAKVEHLRSHLRAISETSQQASSAVARFGLIVAVCIFIPCLIQAIHRLTLE